MLRQCLARAAGVDMEGAPVPGVQQADAILVVGGGDPRRRKLVKPTTYGGIGIGCLASPVPHACLPMQGCRVDTHGSRPAGTRPAPAWPADLGGCQPAGRAQCRPGHEQGGPPVTRATPIAGGVTAIGSLQIDAGARVIVTQPPLLWEQWDEWTGRAERRLVPARMHLSLSLPARS